MAGSTDVVVKFLADTDDIKQGVDRIEGTTSKLKSWAGGAAAAIGGAFAVGQIKEFIDAGAELEDQIGAAGVTFGEAAKEVEAWGNTAAEAMGLSKTEAIKAANTFATFGKATGFAEGDLAAFSENLTGLAADLGSFKGTSTEQAVEAIGAALRGESEPIRAYGVMLDDATLKARAMSEGLVQATGDSTAIKSAMLTASKAQETYNKAVKDHGADSKEAQEANTKLTIAQEKLQKATEGTIPDLDKQTKILAAEAEIYAQTTDAQGDFARTSDGAANSQKILAANIENLQTSIGTALLPVVKAIVPVLSSMAKFIQENSDWLVPLAGIVGGVTAAVWLFNAALAANPVVLVTIAIAALAAGLIYAYQNVEGFRNIVDRSFAAVKEFTAGVVEGFQILWDLLSGLVDWTATTFATIAEFLAGPFSVAWAIIEPIISGIRTATQAVIDWFMTGPFAPIVDKIVGPFKSAIGIVTDAWNGLMGLLGKANDEQDRFINTQRQGPSLAGPGNFGGPTQGPSLGGPGQFQSQGPVSGPSLLGPGRFHAAGGIFNRPTLGVIGEAGPEAVIPLNKLQGGSPVTINVYTTGLGADAPSIQSAVVAALRQYTTRNGPLPTAITG